MSGLWKRETDYTAMNDEGGEILGKAVRLYPSSASFFSGGCDASKQTCSFDTGRSILFDQPNAVFADNLAQSANHKEFEGREGHSLIQLGDSVISFGGCQFGK